MPVDLVPRRLAKRLNAPNALRRAGHNLVRAAFDQHRMGGDVPAKQNQFRAGEKIVCHAVLQLRQRVRISFRRACVILCAAERKKQYVIARRVEVDVHRLRGLGDFAHAQAAGDDLLKKPSARKRLIFLRLTLKHRKIVPLLLLGFHLFLERDEQVYHFFLDDGLEQILLHAHANGLLRIGKVVISADDDDFCARQFLTDEFAERKPVHKRHLDIGDE